MSKVTVTAKTGPALQVTSKVINDVADVNFDLARSVLSITNNSGIIQTFDLTGVATVTFTISGSTYTVAVSQHDATR